MKYYAILGASDPEMEAIEKLLRECGVTVAYATNGGQRVHAGNAYSYEVAEASACALRTDLGIEYRYDDMSYPNLEPGTLPSVSDRGAYTLSGVSVLVVETAVPIVPPELFGWGGFAGPELVCTVADHHRSGDAGFGRPPGEFLPASSIGQVIAWLARHDLLASLGWVEDGHVVRECLGQYHGPDQGGMWWCDGFRVPPELVYTAAADHCLGAAYRGECPGVDPDSLLEWRIRSRAERAHFLAVGQGIPSTVAEHEARIRADINAAREELCAAEVMPLLRAEDYDTDPELHDTCRVADMRRDTPIPELVEAATRDGVSYVSGPLIGQDKRRKFTCSGTHEVIMSFMSHWAPENGLVNIYGDPARGFAGGYAD